ncbi:hypothetical protein APA_4588 [Pseudanabaena sp. lw0831]|nr:hypothetical protein APA_4588 [Pseudanabaena sp. lw0831]
MRSYLMKCDRFFVGRRICDHRFDIWLGAIALWGNMNR